MPMGVIDIHHHYVPSEIVGEAKRNGNAFGVTVSDGKDGLYYL